MASRMMRRILVDAARAKGYQKRGGGAQRVTFIESRAGARPPEYDLIALDDALQAYSTEIPTPSRSIADFDLKPRLVS